MIGKVFGNYKVVRKIASGGMGEVFLASDLKLERKVALKFLPNHCLGNQSEISRFLREARAVAALNHPSILTIHEISETPAGQVFMVMDYYPGRTLQEMLEDGPLPESKAVKIFRQIAEGLSATHQTGIIHRDIKPANIIVNGDENVKILDFGLAKLTSQASMVNTPTTYGTAAYMSPEQARGDSVDHRTDIWSLGVVMYQVLTQRLPFPGDFPPAIVYGILNQDLPEIPSSCCSPYLRDILKRMLTKDPDRRYQSLSDVLLDLDSPPRGRPNGLFGRPRHRSDMAAFLIPVITVAVLSGAYLGIRAMGGDKAPTRKSVAALPFENLTGDPEMAIWGTGIPQLILAELSRSPELYVLNSQASETIFQAMGSPSTAGLSLPLTRDFGHRTRVKTLVFGSIMKAGDRWRIQAHLQSAETGKLLTTAVASPGSEDQFFAAADSLARAVRDYLEIREIQADLTHGQRSYAAGTTSAAAYRKFLDGYGAYRRREWGQAKVAFEQALEVDPDYTGAQYWLIWTYRQLGLGDKVEELFAQVKAKEGTLPLIDQHSLDTMGAILAKDHWLAIQSLIKVLDMDPQLREKWGQLGSLYLTVEEPELARSALEKGLELTRQWGDNYPWVQLYRNLADVYVKAGKFDKAIAVARLGLETGDQNRRSMLFWICVANLAKGDRKEAERQLAVFEEELRRKGIADTIIAMNVGFIHLKAGRTADALPRMEAAVTENPGFFPGVSWLATMLVDADRAEEGAARLAAFLAEHPEHPQESEARVALAKLRIENGLGVDEAVADLEALREAQPKLVDPAFLGALGLGYRKQDRMQLAAAALEESWDRLPQYDHKTHNMLQETLAALDHE